MTKLGTIVLLPFLVGLGWFGYPVVRNTLWPPPAPAAAEKGQDLSAADVLAYGRKVLARPQESPQAGQATATPDAPDGPGCAGIRDPNRRILCEGTEHHQAKAVAAEAEIARIRASLQPGIVPGDQDAATVCDGARRDRNPERWAADYAACVNGLRAAAAAKAASERQAAAAASRGAARAATPTGPASRIQQARELLHKCYQSEAQLRGNGQWSEECR